MNSQKRLDHLEQRIGVLEEKHARLLASGQLRNFGAAMGLLTHEERHQLDEIAKATEEREEPARLRKQRADSLAAEQTAQEMRDLIRLSEEQGLIKKRPSADRKPHDR